VEARNEYADAAVRSELSRVWPGQLASRCRFSRPQVRGEGWTLLQQAPPEFLLQPHRLYPMTVDDFAYWLGLLQEHFPDLAARKLKNRLRPFVPFTLLAADGQVLAERVTAPIAKVYRATRRYLDGEVAATQHAIGWNPQSAASRLGEKIVDP
jgi:hypothetical protein